MERNVVCIMFFNQYNLETFQLLYCKVICRFAFQQFSCLCNTASACSNYGIIKLFWCDVM